jgi:arylsulfatase A-like enzyme
VLIVTVDTLRADYLGSAGSNLPATPFLDSLMREGYRFTRAVTPIPRTTQALASLLTGCYPHTTQVRTLYDRMAPEIVSVAELAREKGYATLAVVSNHLLIPERGLDRGFDLYDFADDARDAAQTTLAALAHLAERKEEEALFVWVHYIDPHVPYFPPPEIAAAFDPGYEGPYKLHFGTVKGGTGDAAYPEDLPKAVAVYRNPLPARVNEHLRRLYAAEVRFNDDQIAVLVNWLRRELGDDWLILFTSDHGESLGEHDYYYDHGEYVYNAALRVPLAIILPPGDPLRGSATIDDWVSLVDIMPTLAELLDLPLPDDPGHAIEGRSLVPSLRGERLEPRPLFAESGRSFFPDLVRGRERFDVAGRFRAVVSGEWKLIWAPGTGGAATAELYHLTADPNEERNVYTEDHPEARRLMAHLHSWLRPAGHPDAGPTPEDLERLRSLGYVDASAEPGNATPSDEP